MFCFIWQNKLICTPLIGGKTVHGGNTLALLSFKLCELVKGLKKV